MSPWQAALIPLVIIAVLGSIAFFIGYRNLLSDERANDADLPAAATRRPIRAAGTHAQALSPEEASARREELRAKLAATDRLTIRAPQERAILVQFIDITAPGTTPIQEFLVELRQDFSERITFVARHFPSSDHAHLGAAALEAADRQGHFAPFLQVLTTRSAPTDHKAETSPSAVSGTHVAGVPDGVNEYVRVARELGLDEGQFTRDMADTATATTITADRAEATRAGITRAPALVLLDDQNHKNLTSLQDFRRAVEAVANL
ncbi:DsbA family protein [Arthrobacter sp. TMS1-12-1]